MLRVALCGVFDIPNYGDHLFPLVFRNELHKRITDVETVLFSPFEATESFVENSHIYSLQNMESMHQRTPFDAIAVGGGEIIHWHRYAQKRSFESNSFQEYPMDRVWAIPFFMKMKYNIPLIWNAPGIPYNFDADKEFAKFLFENVDYLSVRNDFSKRVIESTGISTDRIHIVPDTGFALQTIVPEDERRQLQQQVFPHSSKYVVFHCNRFITEKDQKIVVHELLQLKKQGYDIFLLPLAYTHGDDSKLKEINEQSNNLFYIPEKILSLKEIISVIANCSLYVGTSLHGSVTASVFGVKAVAFDYQQTKKTKDLYDLLGLSEYYVTQGENLHNTIEKSINEQQPVDFSSIHNKIDEHFSVIAKLIQDRKIVTPNPLSQAVSFSDFTHNYFSLTYENIGLRQRVCELEEALDLNQRFVEIFKPYKEYAEKLESEKRTLQEELDRTFLSRLKKNS